MKTVTARTIVASCGLACLLTVPALPAGPGSPGHDRPVDVGPSAAPQLPMEPKRLDIELVGQQENMWCWATTTQMIVEFLRRDRIDADRCDEASVAANQKRAELELCCRDDLSDQRADFCKLAAPQCKTVSSIPRSSIDCCSNETSTRVRADYCNQDLRQCAQASVRANARRESAAGKTTTVSLTPSLDYRFKGTISPVDIDTASYRRRSAPIDCCNPDTVTSYEGYWDCNRGGFPELDLLGYTAKSTKCPCRLYQLPGLVEFPPDRLSRLNTLLTEPEFRDRAAATDSTSECLGLLVDYEVTSKEQLDAWLGDKTLGIKSKLSASEDCALTWDVIKQEIDAGRPVAFSWRYRSPGSGHMPVAAGYAVTPPDQKWVLIFDPLPPNNGDWYLVPYSYYVAGPAGRHWRDYWSIERVAATGEGSRPPAHQAPGMDIQRPIMLPLSPPVPAPDAPPGTCTLSASDLETASSPAAGGLSATEALLAGAPSFMLRLGLGSEDPDTALDAVLGGEIDGSLTLADRPLSVCELSLDDLASWKPGEGVEDLLHRPREIMWPIVHSTASDTRIASAVTLRRSGARWRLTMIGGAVAANLQLTAERPDFVLSVPALSQRFVAYGDRLVPIFPNDFFPPPGRVNAGTHKEVLEQLREVAAAFTSPLGGS